MEQSERNQTISLEKEVFVYRLVFGTIFYADGTYYTVQIPEVGEVTYLFQNGRVRNDMISRPELYRGMDTRSGFYGLNNKSGKSVELSSILVEKIFAEYQSNVKIVEELKQMKISEILFSLKEQIKPRKISKDASLDGQLNFIIEEQSRINQAMKSLEFFIKATDEYIKNTRKFYDLVCEMHDYISKEAPPFTEKYGTGLFGFKPGLSY